MIIRLFGLCLFLLSFTAGAHDIIVKRNSNFRAEASSNSAIIVKLKPGDEVSLLEITPVQGYYRALHALGIGYVWARNVEVIPDYRRTDYKHWIDADGDCQDTREEVLIAESEVAVTFKTTKHCKVAAGRWTDPYTGKTFTDPSKLDVDHMVPLENAHRSGAWNWTYQKREAYANDLEHPEQLIAVDASANRSKGSKGPDQWVPPNIADRCQYVRDWEAIKQRWQLVISPAERGAIAQVEAGCL